MLSQKEFQVFNNVPFDPRTIPYFVMTPNASLSLLL